MERNMESAKIDNTEYKSFRQVAEEWLDFIRDKVARTTHDRYSDALMHR